MAGSLNHIVDDDGNFDPSFIEDLGEAGEAMEECFDVIGALLTMIQPDPHAQLSVLNAVLESLNYPTAKAAPLAGKRKN